MAAVAAAAAAANDDVVVAVIAEATAFDKSFSFNLRIRIFEQLNCVHTSSFFGGEEGERVCVFCIINDSS